MSKNLRDCPFKGCKLHCSSEQSHRAKYAFITDHWKDKVFELDEEVKSKKSSKVNYEVLKSMGILWPIKE